MFTLMSYNVFGDDEDACDNAYDIAYDNDEKMFAFLQGIVVFQWLQNYKYIWKYRQIYIKIDTNT